MRWFLAQQQLGGQFYIEQPWTCGTWKLTDKLTRSVREGSTYCRRDQCVDGLTHPNNKLPMGKQPIYNLMILILHPICTTMQWTW